MSVRYILVLSIVFLSCATPEKKKDTWAIRNVIEQYNDAYVRKDWEQLADVFHPRQFEDIPRDFFIKGLNISQKREHFKLIGNKLMIDSISRIVNENSDKYCFVYLRNEIISGFPTADNLEELCKTFSQSFHPDYISCEVKGNQIVKVSKEKYYAVFLLDKKKWFLLNPNEQTKEIIDRIIPAKVRESLK